MGGSDQLEHIRKLYCWRIVAEKGVIQWLLFIARLIIAHIEHQDILVCIRTNSKKLLHVFNSYKNSKMDVKTNVVLNSMGMVIYTSTPHRISTTNATALNPRYMYMGFTFTGNASIASTFTSAGGGGT